MREEGVQRRYVDERMKGGIVNASLCMLGKK